MHHPGSRWCERGKLLMEYLRKFPHSIRDGRFGHVSHRVCERSALTWSFSSRLDGETRLSLLPSLASHRWLSCLCSCSNTRTIQQHRMSRLACPWKIWSCFYLPLLYRWESFSISFDILYSWVPSADYQWAILLCTSIQSIETQDSQYGFAHCSGDNDCICLLTHSSDSKYDSQSAQSNVIFRRFPE